MSGVPTEYQENYGMRPEEVEGVLREEGKRRRIRGGEVVCTEALVDIFPFQVRFVATRVKWGPFFWPSKTIARSRSERLRDSRE